MRILLSGQSKRDLCECLKKLHGAQNLEQLSRKMRMSRGALEKWFYNKGRYIPEDAIPTRFRRTAEIIDQQPDSWGRVKGGQKTFEIILKKYGSEEIMKRRSNGGKVSASQRDAQAKADFSVDANSPLFLELYGALLGDGWLSSLSYGSRHLWWVGISGHAILDRDYLMFLRSIIKNLFGKDALIKYKKGTNGMEIIFCHKHLILFLNKELGFPIGLKKDLMIEESIAQNWDKMCIVIRGIFDTDGCFYLDKTPSGNPYPCIAITMYAPRLLKQVAVQLRSRDFAVQERENRLILKGGKQINKWMKEIGSNNPKHYRKYRAWVNMRP